MRALMVVAECVTSAGCLGAGPGHSSKGSGRRYADPVFGETDLQQHENRIFPETVERPALLLHYSFGFSSRAPRRLEPFIGPWLAVRAQTQQELGSYSDLAALHR